MKEESILQPNTNDLSVFKKVDESYRLQRLLEIFIEVDKNLKKQSNEHNHNK